MTHIELILAAFSLAAGVSLLVMRFYVRWLESLEVFEIPNARSSHARPVLTGGGWVVIGCASAVWIICLPQLTYVHKILLACVFMIASISWIDDRAPLSPVLRLAVQAVAVTALLSLVPHSDRIIWAELPFWIDRILCGLAWLWFINLFNFMDGVDGLAAVETIAIALGIAVVGYLSDLSADYELLAAVIAGSSIGFLYWNWAPARILLGDVGSISLGLLLGWLLIQLALRGHILPALILPLFFVADATYTLLNRMLKAEAFWKPHRKHFYQQPVVAGQPHTFVSGRITLLNGGLVISAVAAMWWPVLAVVAATVCVFLTLVFFNRFRSEADKEQIAPPSR